MGPGNQGSSNSFYVALIIIFSEWVQEVHLWLPCPRKQSRDSSLREEETWTLVWKWNHDCSKAFMTNDFTAKVSSRRWSAVCCTHLPSTEVARLGFRLERKGRQKAQPQASAFHCGTCFLDFLGWCLFLIILLILVIAICRHFIFNLENMASMVIMNTGRGTPAGQGPCTPNTSSCMLQAPKVFRSLFRKL
jgi:hypothetical protein